MGEAKVLRKKAGAAGDRTRGRGVRIRRPSAPVGRDGDASARLLPLPHRAFRRGKDLVPAALLPCAPPHLRAAVALRAGRDAHRPERRRGDPPADRRRASGLPVPRPPSRGGKRGPPPRRQRTRRSGAAAGRGRSPLLDRPHGPRRRVPAASCRAANASARRSPARSWARPTSSSPTSPPATSTGRCP